MTAIPKFTSTLISTCPRVLEAAPSLQTQRKPRSSSSRNQRLQPRQPEPKRSSPRTRVAVVAARADCCQAPRTARSARCGDQRSCWVPSDARSTRGETTPRPGEAGNAHPPSAPELLISSIAALNGDPDLGSGTSLVRTSHTLDGSSLFDGNRNCTPPEKREPRLVFKKAEFFIFCLSGWPLGRIVLV